MTESLVHFPEDNVLFPEFSPRPGEVVVRLVEANPLNTDRVNLFHFSAKLIQYHRNSRRKSLLIACLFEFRNVNNSRL